jgi:hypothetical protein
MGRNNNINRGNYMITVVGTEFFIDGVSGGTIEALLDRNRLLVDAAMRRVDRVAPTPPNLRVITNTQFKALFTPEQLVQIWRLSLTNDAVALLLFDVFTRTTINLDDPRTQQGLSYLVSVGVALDLGLF